MRKALIGLIMAATVMTPIAATARERDGRGNGGDAESNQSSDSRPQRSEARQARQERSEARQETRREAPQPQVQQQQAQAPQRVRQQVQQQQAQAPQRVRPAAVAQGQRGDRRGRGNGGNQQSIYPQAWQGDPNDPRLRRYQQLERQNQQSYGREGRRDGRRDYRNDRRDDRRDWNQGWRNDNRYDWQNWRYQNRNIFRGTSYYAPFRNYRYSRFSIGLFLDQAFFNQRYWIGDPWQYRLPAAPYGTQWVRYYNDVILVDVYTGEVIDVIHDFFW